VRRLADGCFMYLGRRDRWLKIRGFRVSLDEVQAALAALAGIEECRVEVGRDSNNERRLEAFVQVQQPEEDLAPRIKHALRQRVPHFMVPDTITVCAQLPLNANGKVGRMAIPTNNLEDA
jgi:acyl-coenzyme A synthetase/AMP-(fatty) acid ligase